MLVLFNFAADDEGNAFTLSNAENITSQYLNVGDDTDTTEDLHTTLRKLEAQIDHNAQTAQAKNGAYLKYAQKTGSQKVFKVINSMSSTSLSDTVTATLRYTTEDRKSVV